MAIKFTNTSEACSTANVLVYGGSKVGKTVLSATTNKPVIISSEGGLMSIADYNIKVLKVATLQDFKDAYEWVLASGDKYKTSILDSITDIADAILFDFMQKNNDQRKAYHKLQLEVAALIRKFRDMDKDTVFIASQDFYENASGLECYRPCMPGKKMTAALPFFFDQVLCLRLGEKKVGKDETRIYRYLQTAPSVTHLAGDRSRKLNPKERTDLSMVLAKIKAKPKKKKKKKKK